jgi:hypothetical protein
MANAERATMATCWRTHSADTVAKPERTSSENAASGVDPAPGVALNRVTSPLALGVVKTPPTPSHHATRRHICISTAKLGV